MAKSTRDITKSAKKRPQKTGEPVMVRLQDEMAARLDDWRRKQADMPGRPEAIRRLVELGLGNSRSPRPTGTSKARQTAKRAAELAAKVIDKHLDPSTPTTERAIRKRKILEGPSVIRDIRKDRP
jgi:hypothetical protein